jgi:hypothetical protein
MKDSYITYFQSVLTLGLVTRGDNEEEAEHEAEKRRRSNDVLNYCFFEQTPYEATSTEKWSPEFEREEQETDEGIKFILKPDSVTRNIIANKLRKKEEDLTPEDIEEFTKEAIDYALKNH